MKPNTPIERLAPGALKVLASQREPSRWPCQWCGQIPAYSWCVEAPQFDARRTRLIKKAIYADCCLPCAQRMQASLVGGAGTQSRVKIRKEIEAAKRRSRREAMRNAQLSMDDALSYITKHTPRSALKED